MPPSSRERVGSRSPRREELVAAGLLLLRDSSIDAVAAPAIAKAAGVSKALVYYYFPTQPDLQAAVAQAGADHLVERIRRSLEGATTQAERLTAGVEVACRFMEKQPEAYAAMVRGANFHPRLLEVIEYARNGIVDVLAPELGLIELTAGQRIALRSWIALSEESILTWVLSGRPVRRSELVAYCRDLGLHILDTPLGRG